MLFFPRECDNSNQKLLHYVQTKLIANIRPAMISKKKPAKEDENGISEGVAYHKNFQGSD